MKRTSLASGLVTVVFGVLMLCRVSHAEIDLPDALPGLPATAELDAVVAADVAAKGYHVAQVEGRVHYVTDGNYQAMIVLHDRGAILLDAPEPLPFLPPLPVVDAVAELTDLPITHLIYSHAHTDHIGGAFAVVEAFPEVEIIAQLETTRLLARAKDPRRPVPTQSFRFQKRLRVGGSRLDLEYRGNTHVDGNLFAFAPREKVLAVVDVIYPGWVPFRRLGLSDDIPGWIAAHDEILSFPFETLIAGHLTRLGTREDVRIQKEYVQDIVDTIENGILDASVLSDAVGAIDAAFGSGTAFQTVSKWVLFSAFFDASISRCAEVLDAKYLEGPASGDNPRALGGAETFNFSNCDAYFVARRLGVEQ